MIGPDDVALPSTARVAPRSAPLQADRRRVDRLLSERPEAFALERNVAVLDLAAEEELLQAIVHGARQDHPAQDLPPLIACQRRGDRLADQKAVACLDELVARRLQSRGRRDAGRRVRQVARSEFRKLIS